jgi:LCP family protein required for cell wall assembly
MEPSGNARSDTIMILTVDFKNKKVKLSSLMRDMYVKMEGYGSTKLNHAYAYGGATLSIKTINQNFGTNIRDYAMVDFFTLEKIIDVLGGVTINVKQEEIRYVNENINKVKITTSGEQLLTGNQAVSYSRIRYVGNGDFERTERQRKVLSLVMDKAIEKGVSAVPSLVYEILPLVETSMDKQTILNSALDFFKAGEMTFEQVRFPVDGYYWNDMTTGIYYLKFDTTITKQQIYDYIFDDIKPTPKE